MKPFYQVKGVFFRRVADEYNPVVIDEIFKNNQPHLARQKAFALYQNYIEVLLESRGKEYISHKATILELQDFFNSYRQTKTIAGCEVEADFDKFLAIYLVELPETYTTLEGETDFKSKKLIHCIDKHLPSEYADLLLENLKYERKLYSQNGFEYIM